VADGWCWFVLREEYCWLVCCERKILLAGGLTISFVFSEAYIVYYLTN
jgi:hypothetical protein